MTLSGRHALLQKKRFTEPTGKNLNEAILSAAKCRPMIQVSRSVSYMRIFARVLRGVRQRTISVHADIRYFEHEHMFITYLKTLCVANLRLV